MSTPPGDQLALFAADQALQVKPAPVPEELGALAVRWPQGFRLGTCGWAYPGWHGLLWARDYPAALLARHGLAAYATHPLLGTVSLDLGHHVPLSARQYAAYAAQVPVQFRFVVKAPAEITSAMLPAGAAPGTGRENRRFLDHTAARRSLVEPVMEGLGERLGMVLLQFPPMPSAWVRDPLPFIERLQALLLSLPAALPRAVELRNPELLVEPLFHALLRSGTRYCYTGHPAAPPLDVQHQALPAELAGDGPLVVRWTRCAAMSRAAANVRFSPFSHLQAEDRINRPAIVSLCRRAIAAARPAYILAGNAAEGSAPATLFRLAEEIAPKAHA